MTKQELKQATDDALRELNELDSSADRPAPVRARRNAKNPSQVYSLRIPVEQIEQLRQLAEARHETPSGLLRRWVLHRLELEFAGRGAEDQTADLDEQVDRAVGRALSRRGLVENSASDAS